MKACFSGYDSLYNRIIKRILDVIAAVPLLLLALPVYLIVTLAIIFDDGFPVFYRPLRGGYLEKDFQIFKFRTMVRNADKIGGGTTADHDPRITRVGRFLRKTKLDETANLLNILGGTMSFVGPRPELLRYTRQYSGKEKCILKVRPGVTDYSSLEFINLDEIVGSENPDAMYEKLVLKKKNELRIRYAETVSFSVDLKLIALTIRAVCKKAVHFIFSKTKS